MMIFSGERLSELLDRFGPRVKRVPFTIEGMPTDEEVSLTRDIWSELTGSEKELVLRRTRESVAQKNAVDVAEIPDQTPYAMRLTHKYLQLKARQAS